jgi:hypothetical protein
LAEERERTRATAEHAFAKRLDRNPQGAALL